MTQPSSSNPPNLSQSSNPSQQTTLKQPSLPSSRSSRTTLAGGARMSKSELRNNSSNGTGTGESGGPTARRTEKGVIREPVLSWKKGWSDQIDRAPATGLYCSLTPAHGSPPPPLKAHTATLVGDKIYIIGGSLPSSLGGCFRSVATFNIYTNLWTQLTVRGDVPPPIRAHTSIAVGDSIWIFGGGDREDYSNETFCFDTRTSTFTKPILATPQIPSRRRAHSAAFVAPHSFIIFGGGDGGRALNDTWIFDTVALSWRLVGVEERRIQVEGIGAGEGEVGGKKKWVKLPGDRGYHSGHFLADEDGGKMLVFGGSDGQISFATIDALELKSSTWHRLDRPLIPSVMADTPSSLPFSFARAFHASVIIGHLMFVYGGHDSHRYSNQSVLCFDLRRRKWLQEQTLHGSLPPERGYHSLTLADHRLFVYGGSNGSSILGDLWTIDLTSHSALLCGPPVKIELDSTTT